MCEKNTKRNTTVAISQRHPSKYYSHLQQPSVASDDENDENDDYVGSILYPRPPHPHAVTILAFFESYVRDRFAGGSMSRYVMDVYLEVRDRAWIVDFNVWGGRMDCGPLFEGWGELSALGDCARGARSAGGRPIPEMRVVTRYLCEESGNVRRKRRSHYTRGQD